MKNFIGMLLLLLVIISCTKKQELNYTVTEKDGIKSFNNKNIPSDTSLTYKLTKLFTIGGDSTNTDTVSFFRTALDLEVDKLGNIYILDVNTCSIKKFDAQGKFVTNIGRKGSGPGEFVVSIDFAIMNDTLYVEETETCLMIRFDLNGKFIDKVPYVGVAGLYLEESIKSPAQNLILGYKPAYKVEGNNTYTGNSLVLMDNHFKEKKELRNFSSKLEQGDIKFFEMLTKFTFGNGKIYVADNNEDQYKINVFDFNGKQLETINKKYMKMDYNEEESDVMKKRLNLGLNNKKIEQKKAYKKSINALYYDKYGRLLVCSSLKRNKDNINQFHADVFKDGVFLNSVNIKELQKQDYLYQLNDRETYFFNDRIYYLNRENATVTVYDYQ